MESIFETELLCSLSEDEVLSRGRMLGDMIAREDEIEEARKKAMTEFKEKLTGVRERQRELAGIIRERRERRLVRCVVQYHIPEEGRKRMIRIDTGEVIDESWMTDAEKQL